MKTLRFSLAFLCLWPHFSHGNEASPRFPSEATSTFPLGFSAQPQQEEGWQALPRGRPFPSLLSDPRDLRLGIRKNNRAELEADVGGYRSLAGWKGECHGENLVFHTGIEGGAYFLMRQTGSKFPLHSSDGLIGLYAEASRGLWMYQFRFTHISAHLSDGLVGIRERFVYTREFIVLRVARQLGYFRPYLGYQLLSHTAPALPRHSAQLGGYAILPMHWGIAHPYLGVDLRVRNAQEGSTVQVGVGAALVGREGEPPVRITANYLKGHDPRGQFFTETAERWTFGLDLDL